MNEKSQIRRAGREARLSLSDEQRENLSLSIAERVAAASEWRRATRIASYIPMSDEVDTWPITERAWRMGKRIFVPVIKKKSVMRFIELTAGSRLARNRFGLLEPDDGAELRPDEFDIVLTPLVAFDDRGNRIGMGGGFYDRAFAFMNNRLRYRRPKMFGLAFACQQTPRVPASPWDIPVFQVYTEDGPALKPQS